ncbi:hypothetical protein NQZ68_030773 [Dissostichus eleginoides]|nr:hypothetical protein NQZ68_030773 [Dissostichus eleginoides]
MQLYDHLQLYMMQLYDHLQLYMMQLYDHLQLYMMQLYDHLQLYMMQLCPLCFLGINPETGSKAKKKRGVINPHVSTFFRKLLDFEWTSM